MIYNIHYTLILVNLNAIYSVVVTDFTMNPKLCSGLHHWHKKTGTYIVIKSPVLLTRKKTDCDQTMTGKNQTFSCSSTFSCKKKKKPKKNQ